MCIRDSANIGKSAMDMLYVVKDSPIIELKEQPAQLLKDYFSLLVKTYGFCGPKLNKDILNHLLSGVLLGVGAMYKDKTLNKTNLSKAEQISKNFNHLVMQNYTTQRSVAWYAKKLGITPAHLSTIVKQTTCLLYTSHYSSLPIISNYTSKQIYITSYCSSLINRSSFLPLMSWKLFAPTDPSQLW